MGGREGEKVGGRALVFKPREVQQQKQTPLFARREQESHSWVTPDLDIEKLFNITLATIILS